MAKAKVSVGISTECLVRSSTIVKELCKPPMAMQHIIVHHLEQALAARSKGVAEAIRFQIRHAGPVAQDWEKFADLVEQGLEMEYTVPKEEKAA